MYLREGWVVGNAGDINVFEIPGALDFDWCRSVVHDTGSSCLFVRGSGLESALA